MEMKACCSFPSFPNKTHELNALPHQNVPHWKSKRDVICTPIAFKCFDKALINVIFLRRHCFSNAESTISFLYLSHTHPYTHTQMETKLDFSSSGYNKHDVVMSEETAGLSFSGVTTLLG